MIGAAERRRRRRPLRWLLGLLGAAVLFVCGVALGKALQDNPKPNLTITTTKTIVP